MECAVQVIRTGVRGWRENRVAGVGWILAKFKSGVIYLSIFLMKHGEGDRRLATQHNTPVSFIYGGQKHSITISGKMVKMAY